MLDNILHFFLEFSHDTIIIPLIVIGYIWFNKRVFFHGISLLLISILFNSALKITFQIPLSPILNKEGFAFPSGHMQSSVVLYGWIFRSIDKLLIRILIIILLAGTAVGLLHFGYHNYFDILGAIFFGLILISIYTQYCKRFNENTLFLSIFFSTLLIFYIGLIYGINEHIWMTYYSLIGIVSSEYCFKNREFLVNNKAKLVATIFCVAMTLIINKIFSSIKLALFLSQLKWLFIGYNIPFSLHFLSFIKSQDKIMQYDK